MTRRTVSVFAIAFAVVLGVGAAVTWVSRTRSHQDANPSSHASMRPVAPDDGIRRGDVDVDTRRRQLIGVRTVKAARSVDGQPIRAAGAVRYDEARVVDVNVKLDGWVRDLFADFTGRAVRRGDPLLTLYSPDLAAAEQEFVLALDAREELEHSVLADAARRANGLVDAARQRLSRWDLDPADIRAIEETRAVRDTITIRAPIDGVVMEKAVVKGAHVTTGQMLLKLADLSTVWVEADVYESDLPSVRVGNRVDVTLDAYPGERQSGRVVYIAPSLEEQTRTTTIRGEFPNPRGRLKPGMFAAVEIAVRGAPALILPRDAVLDSGREQIVFVAEGGGQFKPRAITIGRRIGDAVQVLSGLDEGDEVAGAAAFFLDSESQLRGALQSYDPMPSTPPSTAPASVTARATLRTVPQPAKTGDNTFEVTVVDASGVPVSGADVSIQLYMPPMPAMNMPAMRSEFPLPAAGPGIYRGPGQIPMAGQWTVTVKAVRNGRPLADLQQSLVAN